MSLIIRDKLIILSFALILAVICSVPVLSQTEDVSAAAPNTEANAEVVPDAPSSIGEYYARGGFVMHLILVTSIIAAAIAIERVYHFRRARKNYRGLIDEIKMCLADDLIYKAMSKCDEVKGPVAQVLKVVLKNMDKDGDTIRDAVDAVGLEEIPRLERHLYALAIIANVATLLGLLGTILGMIKTFASIAATTTGIVNVHILADGIWTAMLTTAFGLMVAIPTTIVHAYLNNEVRKFSIAMERSSAELVHYLQHRPGKADEI